MRSGAFLDTDVLLYASQQPDPRSERARALLAQGGSISVQVLNEFADVARRKLRRPWPEVIQALADVRALCPPPCRSPSPPTRRRSASPAGSATASTTA